MLDRRTRFRQWRVISEADERTTGPTLAAEPLPWGAAVWRLPNWHTTDPLLDAKHNKLLITVPGLFKRQQLAVTRAAMPTRVRPRQNIPTRDGAVDLNATIAAPAGGTGAFAATVSAFGPVALLAGGVTAAAATAGMYVRRAHRTSGTLRTIDAADTRAPLACQLAATAGSTHTQAADGAHQLLWELAAEHPNLSRIEADAAALSAACNYLDAAFAGCPSAPTPIREPSPDSPISGNIAALYTTAAAARELNDQFPGLDPGQQ